MADKTEKPALYAWRKCVNCGALFPYNALICSRCYRNAPEKPEGNLLQSRFASLITLSGNVLPKNLIKLNMGYPVDIEGYNDCFNCTEAGRIYCDKFGKPNYSCKEEEQEYCTCKACCARVKGELRGSSPNVTGQKNIQGAKDNVF